MKAEARLKDGAVIKNSLKRGNAASEDAKLRFAFGAKFTLEE